MLGQPALFELTQSDELPEDLSLRERRLLVGALNFHALMAPGRELTVHEYGGGWEALPRTSDDMTFAGLSRAFRSREYSVRMRSLVTPEDREPIPAERTAQELIARPSRHIHVSRNDVLDFDPPRDISPSPIRRVLRGIRARAPLLYDEMRDLELLSHRPALVRPARRRDFDAEFRPGGPHDDSQIVTVEPRSGGPRAVILGLHWFELGGAERWAFETVRLVREAGFLPIVLTNRDSHQPWIMRGELDDALIIPFSEATSKSQTPGVEELLRALLRTFDVRGVVVHHNQWLYDRLHWIARSRPDIPIIDSTHIVEYRGGGYPLSSVLVEEVITRHHVVSPALERWMVGTQRVDPARVVMAPLRGLTVGEAAAEFRERRPEEPFTVAFIGRMARQKAPEVFVAMAHRLRRQGHDLRFIMHGDGEMASWVDDLLRAYGLDDVIRRDSSVPVTDTLDQAHLLVITSHNEGLTLTTFEALAHGIPVVSTNVGAQSDVVPPSALIPRNVHLAVRRGASRVAALARDEAARRKLWQDEYAAERRLEAHEPAGDWFAKEISTW